jgi:hypothetical protein
MQWITETAELSRRKSLAIAIENELITPRITALNYCEPGNFFPISLKYPFQEKSMFGLKAHLSSS